MTISPVLRNTLFVLLGVGLGVVPTLMVETILSKREVSFVQPPPAPVQDRVRRVVLTWSGATNVDPKDTLDLVIWGGTIGQHDYDFQPGGADSLIRMLKLEFRNPPARKVNLFASSLGQKGTVKTFADLVDSIQ
jgi:hypothetical protein